MGGVLTTERPTMRVWERRPRGACGAIRRRQKSASGRGCLTGNWRARGSGGTHPSGHTSSTSSASMPGSSSSSMAVSTWRGRNTTQSGRIGSGHRGSRYCVFGSMTRCKIRWQSLRPFDRHSRTPHPDPLPKGGREFDRVGRRLAPCLGTPI